MNTEIDTRCIFCGGKTAEQHSTRDGLFFVHSKCLSSLQEFFIVTEDDEPMQDNTPPPPLE